MGEQKIGVQLVDWGKVAWKRKHIIGGILVGCTVISVGIAFLLPKQYSSTTLVQTRSASLNDNKAAMASALGMDTGFSTTLSYMELMKSRTVLDPIIDDLPWEKPEDKPDAKNFAKKYLDINNTKNTNLIEVTAKAKSPEDAQKISQSVVDNFLAMQTNQSQQTQSLLVAFLNNRIDEAKEESDNASQKLADFSREHKIYSPDDQIKQAITQVAAYDKTLADLESQEQAAQAQYDVASNKLGKQVSGSKAYNINDNSTVQGIRTQIVTKEVELAGLRQKYTDNHPAVVAAQRQLNQLQNALTNEVNAVVESNATSLNTTQMELLKTQAVSEATSSAAQASIEAIKSKKNDLEHSLDDYPDEMVTYLELKSDFEIKKNIYTNLVQQCEQSKIKEAMEFMDIQIVDPANLPDEDKPSGPNKALITFLGLLVGIVVSVIYSLIDYKRNSI